MQGSVLGQAAGIETSQTVPACSCDARPARGQKCRIETSAVRDGDPGLQMKLAAQIARVTLVGTLVAYPVQHFIPAERVGHTLRPPSRPCSHPSTYTESAIPYSAVYTGRGWSSILGICCKTQE